MPDPYREPTEEQTELANAAPKPGRASVEQEILELEQKLAQKKAEQEKAIETALGMEKPKSSAVQAAVEAPTSSALEPKEAAADTANLRGVEKDQQLKSLVDLAFQKGVAHATEVVRNLDNPYLLDEFHDVLIDKFREELVKRGKLDET